MESKGESKEDARAYAANANAQESGKAEALEAPRVIGAESKRRKPKEIPTLNIEVGVNSYSPQIKWIAIGVAIAAAIVIALYIISSNDESAQISQKRSIDKQNQAAKEQIERIERPALNAQDKQEDEDNQGEDNLGQEIGGALSERASSRARGGVLDANTINTPNMPSKSILTITPKREVWFAYMDIVTKKKGDKYTKAPYSMEISNPMIFHFGNGLLTLEIDGEVSDFNQQSVTYMSYTKEEGFKIITQRQYKELAK